MRRFAIALTVLLAALPASAEEDAAKAKEARDALSVLLVDLADEARARGDATAAQAIAETVSFIAGVPHPHLDALRRELVQRFETETPWDFKKTDAWKPIRHRAWDLSKSPKDRVDANLVRFLPSAVGVTRLMSSIRVANGLKAMRYDGKRSAKNVAMSRDGEVPSTHVAFLGQTEQTVQRALADVGFRALLFDPADKGITFGAWHAATGVHTFVLGLSGNRRLTAKSPARVVFPPPGSIESRWVTRLREKGEEAKASPPLSVHFYRPFPDLEGATATVGGTPCEVTVRDIGDQRVASFAPPRSLHRVGRFTAEVRGNDDKVLSRWSFTTRR